MSTGILNSMRYAVIGTTCSLSGRVTVAMLSPIMCRSMRSTVMPDGNSTLSKDTLWQDYYTNLKTALSSMRQLFRLRAHTDGLTQDDIAALLQIDKSLVSRRLNGEENFTLKTLSFMATEMCWRLQLR